MLLMGHESNGYSRLRDWFQLRDDGAVDYGFRLRLFGLVIANMLAVLVWEGHVIPKIGQLWEARQAKSEKRKRQDSVPDIVVDSSVTVFTE
jgi:hypothetical protein